MNAALDDARLLRLIRKGEKQAFAVLVRRHSERFYRVAYRFSGHRTEAEDIVQEAFIKLWEKPDMWQEDRKTAFTTWFYRVVVNMCLDWQKKKRPLPLEEGDWVADERQTHEETMLIDEKQFMLEAQIRALPERQRTALNLCFYEELSNQEAADIMGVRLKALQSLLMRAKTTLRERIGELYADREAV
ncbi:MAG TPA: sigma-70 family RNA polymerase sigma factor [Rickettsiales bacterium]|nr:sigma-70 family RNA polymerase sigma factor [Rickettsiales bacterium]